MDQELLLLGEGEEEEETVTAAEKTILRLSTITDTEDPESQLEALAMEDFPQTAKAEIDVLQRQKLLRNVVTVVIALLVTALTIALLFVKNAGGRDEYVFNYKYNFEGKDGGDSTTDSITLATTVTTVSSTTTTATTVSSITTTTYTATTGTTATTIKTTTITTITTHNISTHKYVDASRRMHDMMNLTADPCEDFYEYVCGNFSNEFILPNDMLKYDAFREVEELIFSQGKTIMEEVSDSDWPSVKKAKMYYRSCMNEKKLESLGLQPIKEKLKQLGGWPVIEGEKWKHDNSTHFKNMDEMGRLSFGTNFRDHLTKAEESILSRTYSHSSPFGLPKKYFSKGMDGHEVQEYYNYMKTTAVLIGAEPNIAEMDLKETLLFEMALSSLNRSNNDEIDRLIKEANPRVVANYLGWRMTESALKHLNKQARNVKKDFLDKLYGYADLNLPRWKECLYEAGFNTYSNKNFRIPLSSIYVKKYVPSELKSEIISLINYIKETFFQDLSQSELLEDAQTKKWVTEKLSNMKQFAAYPVEIFDQGEVDQLFEGIFITEDDYLGNSQQLSRLNYYFLIPSWIDHSLVLLANAFYINSENAMEFAAGLLQGSFYNREMPKYYIFGTTGWIIGHEMVHGFDDTGVNYDFKGKWNYNWMGVPKDKFDKKTECLVHQYSNFTSKQVNIHLNGQTTLGENIADNGGLNQAYLAYDRWLRESKVEEEIRIPELHHLTSRQLFFVSYAHLYCSKYTDSQLIDDLTDTHSVDKFRLLGPIMNSKHFARDFKCGKGSKMNPVDKCYVW